MGLILITPTLTLILNLDALRNQISIHLKIQLQNQTRQERNKETKQSQTELSMTEYYNPLNITGQIVWKKEKEPPEYESITENTEEDMLLLKRRTTPSSGTRNQGSTGNSKKFPKRNNGALLPLNMIYETKFLFYTFQD